MAGLGHKTFVSGTLATAADVNGYLMDQAVAVFASATARNTAIPSPSEGMVCYLTDSNPRLTVYNGSTWLRFDLTKRTYTPTLTASTTNPTIGAGGSITGSYWERGDHWEVMVEIDSGSFVNGVGTYAVSVPSGVGFPTLGFQTFHGHGFLVYGTAAGQMYPATPRFVSGTQFGAWLWDHNAATPVEAFWGGNTPSSWPNNQYARFHLTVEA